MGRVFLLYMSCQFAPRIPGSPELARSNSYAQSQEVTPEHTGCGLKTNIQTKNFGVDVLSIVSLFTNY